MPFQIYKSVQGRYTRISTAVGAGLVILTVSYYVWVLLNRHIADAVPYKVYIEYAVPAALFGGLAVLAGLYLNKPKVADFLIATESEMKKVSWSNRAELLGSTLVVIVTVILLAVFIYFIDTGVLIALRRGLGLW